MKYWLSNADPYNGFWNNPHITGLYYPEPTRVFPLLKWLWFLILDILVHFLTVDTSGVKWIPLLSWNFGRSFLNLKGKHGFGIERIECVSQVGHKLFNKEICSEISLRFKILQNILVIIGVFVHLSIYFPQLFSWSQGPRITIPDTKIPPSRHKRHK